MEADPDKDLRDRIGDPLGYVEREHGDIIRRYETASKLSRWLILRQNPDVKLYFEARKYSQSVRDAIISAQQNEGQLIVH